MRFVFPSFKVLAALLVVFAATGCSKEAKKKRLIERANAYFVAGDYDKARIEYMNVLRVAQDDPVAMERLGTIWYEMGSPLQAGPFLNESRKLTPGNLETRAKLARIYLSVGQMSEARKEGQTILSQAPAHGEALQILVDSSRTPEELKEAGAHIAGLQQADDAGFHIARAMLALRMNDVAGAGQALRKAVEVEPNSAAAHFSLAKFHLLQKETDKVREELAKAAELGKARSAERVSYAEFLAQSGQGDEAKTLIEAQTKKAPDFFPAWKALAQIALAEKKFDDVHARLVNIFSRDPVNFDGRLIEGLAFLAEGKADKAVDSLKRLSEMYPQAPAVKFQLARAYLLGANTTQAATVLGEAIALNPDFAEANILLAELNLRAGNAQAVVTAMEALLKKRPDIATARILHAEACRSLGRFNEAVESLQQLIQMTPDAVQAHFLLGIVLLQQKKTDEARKVFEKAAEMAPDNLVALQQLIELDLADKNFDAALARVQQKLAKAPEMAGAHFLEGRIRAAQGKWPEAEAALLKALELDPNLPPAYDLLIAGYVASNRLPDALKQSEALLAKQPENARALLTAALIHERLGDSRKAADAYEQVLAKNPESAAALNNLAWLYTKDLNDLNKAFELATKARGLRPTDGAIADTLGWIHYKRGEYKEALQLLQESAEKMPNDPEVQHHLGMAAYMMGRTAIARTALKQAVEGSRDFPGKEEARKRLAALGESEDAPADLPVAELEAMLKANPEDPVTWLRFGQAQEKQQAFAKAAEAYERALKINPGLVKAVTGLAQLHAGPLQDKAKALDLAKKARELAPGDPQVGAILGSIAFTSGNFTWAYGLLHESAGKLTDNAQAQSDLGWAAYSVGKVSEAQQAMQRVVDAAPDSPQAAAARSFLTMVALDQNPKDLPAAEPQVEKLLAASPDNVPALMARAQLQKQKGESKAAAATYTTVLQRFPDFTPAQRNLAALYAVDPDNRAKAYELAVKARKASPDDTELARVLADISYQRKEFAYAIQLYRESAAKTPLDASGLYHVGMSHWQLKQKDESRQALEGALKAGLQEPLAAEARRVLAELEQK